MSAIGDKYVYFLFFSKENVFFPLKKIFFLLYNIVLVLPYTNMFKKQEISAMTTMFRVWKSNMVVLPSKWRLWEKT